MLIRWLLAAIHLLAFGFALGVGARARPRVAASRCVAVRAGERGGLRDVFRADRVWGVTAHRC